MYVESRILTRLGHKVNWAAQFLAVLYNIGCIVGLRRESSKDPLRPPSLLVSQPQTLVGDVPH